MVPGMANQRKPKVKTLKPLPSLKGVLGAAQDFYVGAGVLHEQIEKALAKKTDNKGVAPGSFVILGALHLELMFKALLIIHKRPAWGHNLMELFEDLPRSERTALETVYMSDRSHGNTMDLQEAVKHCKDAFVHYRYAYDYKPDKLLLLPFKDLIRSVTTRVDATKPEPQNPWE